MTLHTTTTTTTRKLNVSNISAVTEPILTKFLNGGSRERVEQFPSVKVTFVQTTFVHVTFVHIRIISAVSDLIVIKLQK